METEREKNQGKERKPGRRMGSAFQRLPRLQYLISSQTEKEHSTIENKTQMIS
jgi:hypothetical protein